MASLEVFYKFNEKLLSLPMRDVKFLAKLTVRGLLPGDLKDQVKDKSSLAEAADHFLDNSIKRDLNNGEDESLLKLLSAMEEFSSRLRTLAGEIRDQLPNKALPKKYQQGESLKLTGVLFTIKKLSILCIND